MADVIKLTGLNGTVAQIRAAAEVAAASLQEKIADAFEDSKTLRGKVHTPSAAHTERKEAEGFDTRPGHMSGRLQESLRFDQLYTITVRPMTLWVAFDINLSDVEYAAHYSDLYTRGGNLLAITKKAEQEFRDEVIDLLPQAKAKPKAKPKAKAKKRPKAADLAKLNVGSPEWIRRMRLMLPTAKPRVLAHAVPVATLAAEIAEGFKRVRITRRAS